MYAHPQGLGQGGEVHGCTQLRAVGPPEPQWTLGD